MARNNQLHIRDYVRPEDLVHITKNCRDIDKESFKVFHPDKQMLVYVHNLMKRSKTFCVDGPDNFVIAIYGVFKITNRYGLTWMFGTDEINKYKIEFARRSREVFEEIKAGKYKIMAVVYKKDLTSLKWHKWLGFAIIKEKEDRYEMALKGRAA